jgi:hypothetical protein
MGEHPGWPCHAYLFDRRPKARPIWYTDPLVVENVLAWAYDSWRDCVQSDGIDAVGPCCLEIAPDAEHKANCSGNGSYELPTHVAAIDATLRNEPHNVMFLDYLRIAFRWGGFPGFVTIADAPQDFIAELTRGLLPI